MKKADVILAVFIVLCSSVWLVLTLIPTGSYDTAQIKVNGSLYQEVDLSEDQLIPIQNEYDCVIEVKDHDIRFLSSTCPNQTCVHSGFIAHTTQSAVCIPNRVSIQVITEEGEQIDVISE